MVLRSTPAERLRQWVGNIIIAWTLVASMAAVLGAAYYQRTGNPRILWGVMGGAGAGCAALIGFAVMVSLLTRRARRREPLFMPHEKHVPRQQLFMGRR
ncbi:MAG: hypothetical protein QOE90_628 [Thermoplasmata archaeon]|jgi:hypothetical protein|nr:hypothetical protein [Thermoplasmata archaeon]